jgi:predicted Fe-Mo cluster-binding NifX family protein
MWTEWAQFMPKGTRITSYLKELNIANIITKDIHFLALSVFKGSGMNVYKSEGENLQENILYFQKKELKEYESDDFDNSSLCSGTCSTCSTTSSCEDKK